jgi:hypothetical protein
MHRIVRKMNASRLGLMDAARAEKSVTLCYDELLSSMWLVLDTRGEENTENWDLSDREGVVSASFKMAESQSPPQLHVHRLLHQQ